MTATPFSFGENITPEQVNYDGSHPYADGKEGHYRRRTVPVKSLPANPWGLYEMHGNVWEWTQDTWHSNYDGAPDDGSAWESKRAGAGHVVRGGSWNDDARYCRSAYHSDYSPDDRFINFGFRCARVQASKQGEACEPVPAQPAERIRPGQGRWGFATSTGTLDFSRNSQNVGGGLANPDTPGALVGGTADVGSRLRATEAQLIRLDAGKPAVVAIPQAKAFHLATDREWLTLRQTTRPKWARTMGRDRFGLWADFAVESAKGEPVIQRLRWIPPGRFLMGSPEDESGRYVDEGPQHPVIIKKGFWLFDTPCTQALWEAVMGSNPSRFKSQSRPVERVSWNDVQKFMQHINEQCSGLDLSLPTEAQWEYACRAGTATALYTGGIEIRGDMDAPALDPIAWYGGNSGMDYDLSEWEDSTQSWWKGRRKQYDHQRAGTRQVKARQANSWGLYDMLGNVWEWVQDPWHNRYEDAPDDGSIWEPAETGANCVVRGGSWSSLAKYCRSACRIGNLPYVYNGDLGFRCARVQD